MESTWQHVQGTAFAERKANFWYLYVELWGKDWGEDWGWL